jgi:hypothetical protein
MLQLLLLPGQAFAGMAQAARPLIQLLGFVVELACQGAYQRLLRMIQPLLQFCLGRRGHFRRGCGRGRAQVGDKVTDGKVGFVPYTADQWNRAGGQRTRHDLFIE